MQIDVPTMIRQASPNRRGTLVLPPIDPPPSLARPLAQIYLLVVRHWVSAIHRLLLPSYRTELAEDKLLTDAALMDDVGRLRGDLASVAGEVERLLPVLDPKVRDWALSLETFHRGKWARNLLKPTTVNLATMMGPQDVGRSLEAALAANASLIRNVSSELQSRIEGIILRGFTARTPAREIGRELARSSGLSRARALRIAQDQTLKLSSELDGARMQQAGINDWEWRHSGKLHPRLDHKARNGKRYNFTTNKPPEMPGQLPFCGCKKLAVLVYDEEPVAPARPQAPPAPEPVQAPPPPAPPRRREFRSPINPALKAATIKVGSKAQAERDLRATVEAAAADRRYGTSQGDRWSDRSEADHGLVKLGGMSKEAASTLAALMPELNDLADQLNIPRIRGIKGVGKARANANMGDGVLGVSANSFDGYAAAVGGRTPIDRTAIEAERTQISERYQALSLQLRRRDITREEEQTLLAQLRELRARDIPLYNILVANSTVRNDAGSTWKPGDPVSKRPGNVDAYFSDGVDRMRRVLFHEFGHHVHQQLGKRGPIRFQGDPPVELELKRLWGMMSWQRKELQPSNYATSDQYEWFAENFAAYVMGRRDLVDQELLDLIERMFRGEYTG